MGIIDTYDVNRVVARKDHGIEQLSEFEGQTGRSEVVNEFLLARLLTLKSIPSQDVVVVDLVLPAVLH